MIAVVCILSAGSARAMDRQFTCTAIKGTNLSSVDWTGFADGFGGQQVTLIAPLEDGKGWVHWDNGNEYEGLSVSMPGGFVVISVGDDWTEVYHVNASSLDLMMTATRSGSGILPNAAKAFHGTCRPGQ